MLGVDGVLQSTFRGFSIDGHNTADTLIFARWSGDMVPGRTSAYSTDNAYSDIALSNAAVGLRVGYTQTGPHGGSVPEQQITLVSFDHTSTGNRHQQLQRPELRVSRLPLH